ncbi:hypothetical protein EON65_08040 [archaeon]|nr:MAG: hypothetical protein EON65_08040 [archaeon]
MSNRPSRHVLPAYRPLDRLYSEDLEVSDLTRLLAELQAVSSRTDFQHLSLLLTTERWEEHPDANIR